jgi:hypothetical protein
MLLSMMRLQPMVMSMSQNKLPPSAVQSAACQTDTGWRWPPAAPLEQPPQLGRPLLRDAGLCHHGGKGLVDRTPCHARVPCWRYGRGVGSFAIDRLAQKIFELLVNRCDRLVPFVVDGAELVEAALHGLDLLQEIVLFLTALVLLFSEALEPPLELPPMSLVGLGLAGCAE